MACEACETMRGKPVGTGPHAGQSLVYRRKEGPGAVRLFYVCRLCDTQMLCRLATADHDAGWSVTLTGKAGPVAQRDAFGAPDDADCCGRDGASRL
jgi:hypothetical protein